MTKQELIKRWKTEDGQARLKQVIECLTKGKPFSSVVSLEKYSGRWDLRGAQLSALENEKRIESSGHGVTQKFGTLKLKRAKIESVDFSYADISYSRWERCSVNNCLFQETKAREIRTYATDFLMCVFKKANLSYSYINNVGANAGVFKQVEFIESNLSECLFSFPEIENCKFVNCKLHEVNFDGSRFSNCKFIGKFESGWINGYSKYASKSLMGLFNRVNPEEYPNLMKNVDFSEVELGDVLFSHKVDLSNCKFPEKGDFIIVKNLPTTYIKVREIIEKDWSGEDKRQGLLLIDNFYNSDMKKGMPMDYIDTSYNKHLGFDFQKKFFDLMKSI